MQQMTVILDEEKVRNSNEIFPYEEMLNAIDKMCDEAGLEKKSKNTFVPKKGEDSLGVLLCALSYFKDNADWALKYMKEWTIIDDNGEPEDVIAVLKESSPEVFYGLD